MLLLSKSPLRHKMQKNNVFFLDKTARCRQIAIVLRAVYINAVLLLFLFLFFGTYVFILTTEV